MILMTRVIHEGRICVAGDNIGEFGAVEGVGDEGISGEIGSGKKKVPCWSGEKEVNLQRKHQRRTCSGRWKRKNGPMKGTSH